MKRVTVLLTVAVMALNLSCGDKIQNAKTALALIQLGVNAAYPGVDLIAKAEAQKCTAKMCLEKFPGEGNADYSKCLEQDHKNDPKWQTCYKTTQAMVDGVDKLKPQLAQGMVTVGSIIKAVEAGKANVGAMVKAIKDAVCLLTKLATWLPKNLKEKVDVWLALVSAYSCDSLAVTRMDLNRQLHTLKRLVTLYRNILGYAGPNG